MADVRAMFTQSFEAARAALAQNDLEAADMALRAAVLAGRSDPRLERELAAALLQLGKVAEKRGQGAEAEDLLSEALAISERVFGIEHSGLAPLLSDLGRLHIQQGHHARAAVTLERLLAISRAKGEDRPEVATALAGLALVKRRIGDEEAAEGLYRDALHIREKVLPPNHMVTVVTLEQLSETCAARGKHAEALALLQRALPTREAAVGPEHPTVVAARARVATLQAEIAAAAAKDPAELVFLYKPEPVKRRQAAPPPPPAAPPKPKPQPQSKPQPQRAEASLYDTIEPAAAPLLASPPPPPPRRSVAAAPVAAAAAARPSVAMPAAAPARASTTGPRPAARAPEIPREVAGSSVAAAAAKSSGKGIMMYAAAGVAAVLVAGAALTLRSRDAGAGERTGTPASAATAAAPVTHVASTKATVRNDAPPVVNAGDVRLEGTATPAPAMSPVPVAAPAAQPPTTKADAPAKPAVEAPAAPAAPSFRVDVPRVNVPNVAAVDVDSIVRASTRLDRFSKNDQLGAGLSQAVPIVAPKASGKPDPKAMDIDEPAASRPRIIGRAPVPRFPESLRSTKPEGEVVVRFEVDEHGRVNLGGMTVVRSDHELFTSAVRSILPQFRFEPARLAGPDPKPVAVWVELPFKFTAPH